MVKKSKFELFDLLAVRILSARRRKRENTRVSESGLEITANRRRTKNEVG
jgi:hypothetical protein